MFEAEQEEEGRVEKSDAYVSVVDPGEVNTYSITPIGRSMEAVENLIHTSKVNCVAGNCLAPNF